MPSFTPPTYNQPVNNPLGKHGVSFTVGKVVYIDDADGVFETTHTLGDFSAVRSPNGNPIKVGSGDAGLALFRRGKSYSVTAGEQTLLVAAGYTVT